MKSILFLSSIGILSFGFTSCTNNKIEQHNKLEKLETTTATTPLVVKWLIKSKDFDDMSLVHQVYLVVNGKQHLIDNEVYSLKSKGEDAPNNGPHNAKDRRAYQSMSGYNFEWHVSSADFYVKKEGSNLVVYAEESSDENEGKAETRKIKTIEIKR